MRQLLLIWRRELTSTFLSPVAYVAMAVYLLLTGATFVQAVEKSAGQQESAIVLMFVNSLLETRFERLTQSRLHVRDMVARAKRELALSSTPNGANAVADVPSAATAASMTPMEQPS